MIKNNILFSLTKSGLTPSSNLKRWERYAVVQPQTGWDNSFALAYSVGKNISVFIKWRFKTQLSNDSHNFFIQLQQRKVIVNGGCIVQRVSYHLYDFPLLYKFIIVSVKEIEITYSNYIRWNISAQQGGLLRSSVFGYSSMTYVSGSA